MVFFGQSFEGVYSMLKKTDRETLYNSLFKKKILACNKIAFTGIICFSMGI